jgi:hypothetical protein
MHPGDVIIEFLSLLADQLSPHIASSKFQPFAKSLGKLF